MPDTKEIQQKFTAKTPDIDLLKVISDWEKESEDFYGYLSRIWKENIDYYHGKQTEVDKIKGRESKAVENRIWMATETMIPIATARLPDIVAVADEESEQAQMNAQDVQDILGFQMERVGIQEKTEKFARDMLIKRYGVFKVGWKDKDVDLKNVDPKRIRVPRYGRDEEELAFMIEYVEMSYSSMVDFFGKEITEKAVKSSSNETNEGKSNIREKDFVITETWTNETVVHSLGGTILKKQDNPFWGDNNFLDAPRKPYIIKSLFQTTESIIGDTDYVQQVKPIQDNVNKRKRQIENITEKVANPMLLIDSDVMSEEQAEAISNEPGIILYGKDAASGNRIRFEAPGAVPQYLFQDLEFSRTELDNIWGIHSTTRGEREGRETLGGRKLLRAADLGRIDLVARQIERAMERVAELFTQIIKLKYDTNRAFTILGEDGERFIKSFNSKKIGDIRLIIKPGSTLPKDEITIHDEALQLFQLGAIGVKTLYKMLKLPNADDAVDDFIETRSGQIFQKGQQGQQGQQGLGGLEGLQDIAQQVKPKS